MIGDTLEIALREYEGKNVSIAYIGLKEHDTEIVIREHANGNDVFLVVDRVQMQVKDERK